MKNTSSTDSRFAVVLCVCLAASLGPTPAAAFYVQTNLVSDIPGLAQRVDPNLQNPWGMSSSPTSPIWVSDNGTGKSTLYSGAGVPQALVVTIPPAPGSPAGTLGTPTGQVFNPSANFNNERFIFATEDGTISGFTGATTAILNVNNSALDANYKGLAISTANTLLYAANFHSGAIDVFTSGLGAAFAPVNLGAGAFLDPNLPSGYAPFNIQNIGGSLFVAYAVVDPADPDEDLPGLGNGIVDVYSESGTLLRRLITDGVLDSPWGFALAPANFAEFSNALLVGNFGNGVINAFNPTTGAFLGTLSDSFGQPIVNEGLWGLKFGTGSANGGKTNVLYFTAGINGEANGLFGALTPPGQTVPEPASAALVALGLLALGTMRRRKS